MVCETEEATASVISGYSSACLILNMSPGLFLKIKCQKNVSSRKGHFSGINFVAVLSKGQIELIFTKFT